jgi:hypothetical protein
MITTGLALAALTGAGFYLIYRKLPGRLRRFLQRHILLTDAVACLLTYILFGGTLVALFAAAWIGLIVSIMLALISNPSTNVLLEQVALRCRKLKESILAWADRRAEKHKDPPQLQSVP